MLVPRSMRVAGPLLFLFSAAWLLGCAAQSRTAPLDEIDPNTSSLQSCGTHRVIVQRNRENSRTEAYLQSAPTGTQKSATYPIREINERMRVESVGVQRTSIGCVFSLDVRDRQTGFPLFKLRVEPRVGGYTAEREEQQFAAVTEPPDALTLDQARKCIAVCDAGADAEICKIGRLTCARPGWYFGREVWLSRTLHVIVVSYLHGGGLFAFGPDGALVGSRETGSIGSFQIFDFDHDGQHEFITEEQDGSGTGTETRSYRVYRITGQGFELLWEGLSYSYEGNLQPVEERQGFIRFVESGWGDPHTRLVHLEGNMKTGQFTERVFVMVEGHFRERDGGRAFR